MTPTDLEHCPLLPILVTLEAQWMARECGLRPVNLSHLMPEQLADLQKAQAEEQSEIDRFYADIG